jgi:hypothetical protein
MSVDVKPKKGEIHQRIQRHDDITIRVLCIKSSGEEISGGVRCNEQTEFSQLYKHVAELWGLLEENFKIVFDSNTCEPHLTMKMCGVKNGSDLWVKVNAGVEAPQLISIEVLWVLLDKTMVFHCKDNTPMEKIHDMIAKEFGVCPNTFKLLDPDGIRVGKLSTPRTMGYEEGDQFLAVQENTGGMVRMVRRW